MFSIATRPPLPSAIKNENRDYILPKQESGPIKELAANIVPIKVLKPI